MFCPKCGSMMFPKDGKYVCRKEECGYVEDIKSSATIKSNTPNGEDIAIVGDSDEAATLPKTRVICEKCGHNEAYYTIRQTRSADEPSTTFYRCCKCNHSWREY